ncbi:MAG: phage terminase small subunit P27 family [Planctomycetota bacterium]
MSKRGPAPTPTKKLALRGSWRAATRPGEPRPEPEAPPRPAALDARAALVWDEVVPQLEAAGMLARFDGRAFSRYCELSTVWDEQLAFLRQTGFAHPVKNAKGEVTGVRPYPQVMILLKVHEAMLRVEAHYGMTPASRARVVVEPPAVADPAFDYFGPTRFTG